MTPVGVATNVVVVSAVRSAIGTYGGALKDVPATRLAATVLREAVTRAGVDPAAVGHVVFGTVVPGEEIGRAHV